MLIFILPRIFITAHPSESLIVYIKTVLHPLRNINVLFSLVSYFLPALLLFTRTRFQQLWDELKRRELVGILALYIIFTLMLTDIGGTDVPRFITFLCIPLAICLTVFLKVQIDPLEIGLLFIASLIFNRIFWNIPFDSKENFRAFYGGISTQIDFWTLERTIEVFIYCTLSVYIRTFTLNRRLKLTR